MEKENNSSENIEKKRFYRLNKEELKLLELLANVKSESSPYLYGQPATGGPPAGSL